MVKSYRWQKTAVTATALLCGLWGSNAMALSLGRITVQSALGESLRAEIDIPDINAEEAASLKASVASPEAFRAAGFDYSPIMSGLNVSLQRRANGRSYIRLSSDRTINEPFIDLIIEANWATGRIVRDYTLLFDPPALRQAAPATPTPAQVPAPPAASRAAPPKPLASTPSVPPPTEPRPAVAEAAETTPGQVNVKYGDTAGKIALAAKPVNVSLDQMLVALLRANPTAFVADNVNRVKAGAIMNLPSAQQAQAIPAREATQIIVAQSKDFNEYRRKLAASAPSTPVASAGRQASGSVQAQVQDKQPVTTAPDKLTLSKGAIQGKTAEDQLAQTRNAEEAASRAAEIAKNISDLSQLGAASSAGAPGLAASTAAPAVGIAAITPPTPPASVPLTASAAASAPLTVAALPSEETRLLDELIDNPLAPAGAVGLIVLLAGLGFYRLRQRRHAAESDSSYLESSVQADSLFDANGGQSVDTDESAAPGSALLYSPSQLDADGDVDPVAEADVYLAYGRDLQAEEILQEALQATPERIAIHQKLLEIFAKRRDTKGFEEIAAQAFKITKGEGLEWERICELGLSIDPDNTLYRPGGQPDQLSDPASSPTALDFTSAPANDAQAPTSQPDALPASESVDLDLDFSLDEEPPAAATTDVTATHVSDPASTTPSIVDIDFGSVTEAPEPSPAAAAAPLTDAVDFALPELEVTDNDQPQSPPDQTEVSPPAPASPEAASPSSLGTPAPAPAAEPEPEPATADLGMLEFDLSSLSLDLGDKPESTGAPAASATEDPLATKLALAEEFSAIGDDDGARALIEEVIAEASGDMKIKAQRALSNL